MYVNESDFLAVGGNRTIFIHKQFTAEKHTRR